jgi:hypothetical protein
MPAQSTRIIEPYDNAGEATATTPWGKVPYYEEAFSHDRDFVD